MGIPERKEREKEELRERILTAAKTLFLEKGVEKTSIRNIADQIEYSPGIIYHYFQDKNEIFHALHQGGFHQLMSRMGTIKECIDKGHFQGHEIEALSYLIWSTVHGLVSLHIRRRCEVVLAHKQHTIVKEGLEEFFNILDKL